MSPALLSQRLKELEVAGVISRTSSAREPGLFAYHLTDAGQELQPLIEAFGVWGQRWVKKDLSLEHLDAQLLMWDMRRSLDLKPMPKARCAIQFLYAEQPATHRNWWLLVDPKADVDLCSVDPGVDIDLYVATDLRTMTAIWMGHETVRAAITARRLLLTGDRQLASKMQSWLGLSPFAKVKAMAG